MPKWLRNALQVGQKVHLSIEEVVQLACWEMYRPPSCTLWHRFSPSITLHPTALSDIITSASFVTTDETTTFWQAGMQATCSPACILVPTPGTAPPARAGHSHSPRTPSHRHRTLPYAHGCPWRYCLHMKKRPAYQHRLVLFSISARGVRGRQA